MAQKRIVVEHKDGRRISIDASAYEDEAKNPYNDAADVHAFDGNTGRTIVTRREAKPMDDWKSLKKEGFKPTMAIDPKTGHEVPLDD